MEKRQRRNSKLVTTDFSGSKSAITLLSGDDQTRKRPQQVKRKQGDNSAFPQKSENIPQNNMTAQ